MKPAVPAVCMFAALLVSGGLGLAGNAPQEWWRPGQPIPRGAIWNMATCHQYRYETGVDGTQVAVQGP
jgi:hypothetical protein